MKKWIAGLLPVLLLLSSATVGASSSSSPKVIDKHGAKTYIGTASDWSKTWDKEHFDDITEDDVSCDGSLTIKSGEVEDVSVHGSGSKLLVQGGTMGDVACSGTAEIKKGTLKSLDADGNVKISGGDIHGDVTSGGDIALSNTLKIRGSVEADDEVTLSGTVEISGDLTASKVTIASNAKVTVSGTIKADRTFTLNSCTLKVRELSGASSGELVVNKYTAALPPLTGFDTLTIKKGTSAKADEKIEAETLSIEEDAGFSTTSTLELDALSGPGTLYIRSGKMTVHDKVEGRPLLVFSNSVGKGTTAFYADTGAVAEDSVRLYDYELEIKEDTGGTDKFVLTDPLSHGITFDNKSLSLSPGNNGTVKAHVEPSLSKFASGTKIVWEIYGDSSAFSKSPDSNGLNCKVSVPSSVTGMHKATLIAYLVDSHKDRLTDYRSGSCVLSTGYQENNAGSTDLNLTLDTSSVSVLTGGRYCVLAKTSSGTAPHCMSYNSAVATVGAPTFARDRSGNPGWLYPVTGVGKGKVTIEIGGRKMIATVSSGVIVDTASYTMAPGGKYVIGVEARGVDAGKLSVRSDNGCVTAAYAGKSGNFLLYRLTGRTAGASGVTFSIAGGGSVHTQVTVKSGVKAGGSSSRMVALA